MWALNLQSAYQRYVFDHLFLEQGLVVIILPIAHKSDCVVRWIHGSRNSVILKCYF